MKKITLSKKDSFYNYVYANMKTIAENGWEVENKTFNK